MGITFQEEQYKDIWPEVLDTLTQHWEELANHKEDRLLDIDKTQYELLNTYQVLRLFTVRVDGKLVGYASFMIANNLHYATWKYATSDVYFLLPEYRKTGLSFQFFQAIEDWLKSLDVKAITVQDKINHSREKFFTKIGFNVIEQVYEKVL